MGWRDDRFSAIARRRRGINAEDAEIAEFAERRGEPKSTFAGRPGAYVVKARAPLSHSKRACTAGQFCRGTLGNFG
jgi:hypothetical protein